MGGLVAKKLQNGEKVSLVRCEETNISGSHYRNKLKVLDWLRKRTLTNPKKGPFHHRAPSDMIMRTIRGMVSKNHRNHSKRAHGASQPEDVRRCAEVAGAHEARRRAVGAPRAAPGAEA